MWGWSRTRRAPGIFHSWPVSIAPPIILHRRRYEQFTAHLFVERDKNWWNLTTTLTIYRIQCRRLDKIQVNGDTDTKTNVRHKSMLNKWVGWKPQDRQLTWKYLGEWATTQNGRYETDFRQRISFRFIELNTSHLQCPTFYCAGLLRFS